MKSGIINKVTVPVNIIESPGNNFLAGINRVFPWVNSIMLRLPSSWRDKVMNEVVHINERIVEHPWVFANLGIREGRVLDVGCCWSSLSIELACLGYEVWGIDISLYGLKHPNFKFVREDICETSLPKEYFDRVLAVSTIEHLGLGHFGDPKGTSRDKMAMDRIHILLKPGGKLLLTVPFGRSKELSWFRVYDSESLHKLVCAFEVESKEFYVLKKDGWTRTTEQSASLQEVDEKNQPTGVALILGSKIV